MSDANKILHDTKSKMRKSVDLISKELLTVRTGSPSTSLVDSLQVEHYGTLMPLNQLAHISISEGRVILIQPWDLGALEAIEKSIQKSQLGLTPNNDGKVLRIVIPHLSEERRQELVKVIKKITEDGKIAIRNERRHGLDGIKKLQKDKVITEDDLKSNEHIMQKMTDDHTAELSTLFEKKEKEILTV